ncbi:hypothetical protein BC826DRAFT_1032368 [Russula brevipes]|nr:hypothetical protein BC826DRAFT_1032368 [Russula brevipes]
MFPKSFIAPIFVLALTYSANAHAAINPFAGLGGTATRQDVSRVSDGKPCGNINIAQAIDSSTTIPVNPDGSFSPTITNFNGGSDGSRSIKTVQVDVSGQGTNFVAAKMLVNGDPSPQNDSTESITAQLPPNTKCAGGSEGNRCLVAFATTAGFGNCVIVKQDAGNANPASSPSQSPSAVPSPSGAAKGGKGNADGGKKKEKNNNKKPEGNPKDTGKGGKTAARRTVHMRNWSSRS